MPRSLRSALLALALAPAPALAQDAAVLAALAPPPAPSSLHAYDGTYATDGDTLEIQASDDRLVVVARGEGTVRRWAPLAEAVPALDGRAAGLLDGWAEGRLAPTVAALADGARAGGEVHLTRFLRALTGRLGPMEGYRVLGTHTRLDGHAETLAEVSFRRGTELLRLVWDAGEAPRLRTVMRGASPVVLGRARAGGRDVFHLPAARLSFRRGSDDRVLALTLRDATGAREARRVPAAR